MSSIRVRPTKIEQQGISYLERQTGGKKREAGGQASRQAYLRLG
jgi:hypothetical protein